MCRHGNGIPAVRRGGLWTLVVLLPHSRLKRHARTIRAVHFGALYVVPGLLGLGSAFAALEVPGGHQFVFPVSLGLLVLLAGIAWLIPRLPDVNPFDFWTRGRARLLAVVGLAALVVGMIWTAAVLVIDAVPLWAAPEPTGRSIRVVSDDSGCQTRPRSGTG